VGRATSYYLYFPDYFGVDDFLKIIRSNLPKGIEIPEDQLEELNELVRRTIDGDMEDPLYNYFSGELSNAIEKTFKKFVIDTQYVREGDKWVYSAIRNDYEKIIEKMNELDKEFSKCKVNK